MDNKTKEYFISERVPAYLIYKAERIDYNVENKIDKVADMDMKCNIQKTIVLNYHKLTKQSYLNEEIEIYDFLEFEILKHGIKYFIAYRYWKEPFKRSVILKLMEGNCSEEEMVEIIQNFYKLNAENFVVYLEKIGGEKIIGWW